MKKLIAILMLCFMALSINAQTVISNGKSYTVKKSKIFLDGKEVSTTLSEADKIDILGRASTISEKIDADVKAKREAKALEKANKKAEKALKKAEKAQKQAEKTLKQNQKAQDKLIKASRKLKNAESKYQKLKRKGKLAPNDDAKWLKKIEGIKKDITKAQQQLERS
ncbi:hypothetical protein ESY86_08480 [Subsaximicrobium wynnwilliamsii]|uniref:Uncharacterized protein n=1 Tax=Subsaximicrobium wynnwilliamsii TaxID=291179 RepID=A0A5C6ZGZ0_9FLAO|nr:hypothetical protein [Subsaximicrobium wynnwilliamsii]TXD83705.1 hypothetical protein ESY87_08725 [Subsaximicrobium wynnwilliamsii]TXD89411.1 hypothetical protein ESY86_08480 [Subsaximicrobium wynnwilliamsii]TXE03542.1 hypothetical protein ESY88_07750 [Subsaximicrobium wynnwilliamsii]